MRVLVTGGAGFIGSHVVDKLRAAGHEPRIFDLRPSPHHAAGEVDTYIGDLLCVDDLRDAMTDCDAVAHLAASADVGIVANEPVEAEALNARGTLNVLEAARQSGVDRVVYASTIWVYSDGCGNQVDEDTTVGLPSHLYTATKLAGEMYCKSYSELYDVEFTILRFGIPYGPRARPAAVIPAFVRKALEGDALTIAGEGTQSRRFVYVEDLAEGVADALQPVAANRVYNLVSDRDVSIKEIAHTVRELVGDVEVVHTEARAADFGGVVVCGKRASRELGWEASTPFEEGLRRYIDWYRANSNGNGNHAAEPAPAPAPATQVAPAPRRPSAALGAIGRAVAAGRPVRRRRRHDGRLPGGRAPRGHGLGRRPHRRHHHRRRPRALPGLAPEHRHRLEGCHRRPVLGGGRRLPDRHAGALVARAVRPQPARRGLGPAWRRRGRLRHRARGDGAAAGRGPGARSRANPRPRGVPARSGRADARPRG